MMAVKRFMGRIHGLANILKPRALVFLILAWGALLLARGEVNAEETIEPVAIRGQGYNLIKNWDFSNVIKSRSSLEKEFYTRFIYSDGRLDHLNDEWERYGDEGNHVFQRDQLELVARIKGKMASGSITSGLIRSKWVGEYGYFEAEMEVPPGKGLWPAFWLNPEDLTWPPEIDILEIVNNGRDTTSCSFHFLHNGTKIKERIRYSKLDRLNRYCPGLDFAKGFHRFAVEWGPTFVRHFVDDTLVKDSDFRWQHSDGRDAGPAHVLLNLAVGGSWPGSPVSQADFPAKLKIKFVRVWQKKT